MDRLKTFLIYALMIVGFYIFSNILIFFALNTNYSSIYPKEEIDNQIVVTQAEATVVNGRIKGTIFNDIENDLNGKYLKVDVYSERNVLLGTKYLAINDLDVNATDHFEVYFKAQYAGYYDISIVDSADVNQGLTDEIFISEDMKFISIATAVVILMFI